MNLRGQNRETGSINSKSSDLRSDDSFFVLPGKTIEHYRIRYGSGLQMKSSEYQIYDATTDIESVNSSLTQRLVGRTLGKIKRGFNWC
jgi:hypothetical protein